MSPAPEWWVYYRLIPSIISTIMALTMIIYIVYTRGNVRKERNYYRQLSLFYGVADIIQSVSWLIGPKFDMTYDICSVQEYMFEFGSMCKAMTMAVISWSIFHIIKRMKPFDLMDPEIRKYIIGLAVYAVFGLCVCIIFKTSRLFCNADDEASLASGSKSSQGAFVLVYIVPIYVMYTANVICTVLTFKYIMNLDTNITVTSKLLRPLLPYPLIFTFALVPAGVNLTYHIVTKERHQLLENFSGLGVACCGIFYVLAFFYFQRVEWKDNHGRAARANNQVPLSSRGQSTDDEDSKKKLRENLVDSSDSSYFSTVVLQSEVDQTSVVDRFSEF
jgi:hypothetical protein